MTIKHKLSLTSQCIGNKHGGEGGNYGGTTGKKQKKKFFQESNKRKREKVEILKKGNLKLF